jgi:hypothetical protein
MRSMVRDKVTRNLEYHQQLADHYAALVEGDEEAPADAEYLAKLHAEVAKQLRDVLAGGDPPAILEAASPVTRRVALPLAALLKKRVH